MIPVKKTKFNVINIADNINYRKHIICLQLRKKNSVSY